MSAKYHPGEIEVQERAGVRSMAERVDNSIHPTISPAAREFLEEKPMVVVGLAARRAVGDLEPVTTRARGGSPDEGGGILGDPRGLPSAPTAGGGSVSQSPAKGGAMS